MKQTRLYRGILAMVIGGLALWKGVAAADVAPVDRHEALTVRGESDAVLASIPLTQVLVKKSCVGKDAKKPCNAQSGINNDCTGTCKDKMCEVATAYTCSFCHPPATSEVKSCQKSQTYNCYTLFGGNADCGAMTFGAPCATFKMPGCLTGASCSKTCKDSGLWDGTTKCPGVPNGCSGNANP